MNVLNSVEYKKNLHKAISSIDLSKLKDKSILITGGLGLICSSIVDFLIIANTEQKLRVKIYVAARNKNAFEDRYGNYQDIYFVQYDAMKPIEWDFHLDYIIHGAGSASPELYTKEPVETVLSNFLGIYNILEYSKINKITRVLYISSSEVYGSKDTEDAFVEGQYGIVNIDNIRSSYPIAKRSSEMLCKSYSSEYNVDTVIVRPGHVFGPTASRKDKRISSEFAYKAAEGKELEMKSSGLQKRSYCYSIDATLQVLYALLYGANGEAYNIGSDDVTTIFEMASIYAKAGSVILKSTEPTKEELTAFNPMNNSSLNNSKIKELGYREVFSAEEGFMNTVKILKEMI